MSQSSALRTALPTLDALPTADEVVAHTLLNCLLREISGPEHQSAVTGGRLLLRLPRHGTVLRVALRRTSLLGAHRFTGPVGEQRGDEWRVAGWERLATLIESELSLRTGLANEEFTGQVRSSHAGVTAALEARRGGTHPAHRRQGVPEPLARYLQSEQALLFGHRFHPTPKARSGDPAAWAAYAPEVGAAFALHRLAVRDHLLAQEVAEPGAAAPLDALAPDGLPPGYTFLPAHPWQWSLLRHHRRVEAALAAGDLLDLGPGDHLVHPTASVRTVHDGSAFYKFSLNVRITNCLRKNASYELAGAVALTRRLEPVAADLAARFPGTVVLREPAYRSIALPGDTEVLEGLGVIVREGLGRALPGTTPLLAAAVADEYPTSGAHVAALLAGAAPEDLLTWWGRYLRLLVPPVLAAYADHGVVFEPHLQNVVVGVDDAGMPAQVLLRDLEGTKLVPDQEENAAFLAGLPAAVAGPMTYDAQRGWDRVVYCLLVNHVAEVLAALADLNPQAEPALWQQVRRVLQECSADLGHPPVLRGLLAGVPLPAKANLLTRWERRADRQAGYVRLASPLAEGFLRGAAADAGLPAADGGLVAGGDR